MNFYLIKKLLPGDPIIKYDFSDYGNKKVIYCSWRNTDQFPTFQTVIELDSDYINRTVAIKIATIFLLRRTVFEMKELTK